jgi:site-specific recombinase XerD
MELTVKYDYAVDEYIHRLLMNNLSPRTVDNYKNILWRFGNFLREYENAEDMYEVVEAWRDALTEQGASPSTVCQYLRVLKIFFGKASKRSFPKSVRFPENPVDEDMFPKVVKRPYDEILTDEQVIQIYQSDVPAHFPMWERNYAMLCILLNEKIRNAELLDLRLSDLDFIHHELTIQSGKGRKFRIVDMTELTEQAIAQYLDSGIRPDYLTDEDYLFGTTAAHEQGAVTARSGAEKWHRGSRNWLSNVVERTVRAITGVSDVRSHDLRHIGARVCLNAGQSLEELQGQLGHSSVTTTEIYANKLLQRRRRDSAKAVLSARDAAAEKMKNKNTPQQNIVTFPA